MGNVAQDYQNQGYRCTRYLKLRIFLDIIKKLDIKDKNIIKLTNC
jgi:hypothetical protein